MTPILYIEGGHGLFTPGKEAPALGTIPKIKEWTLNDAIVRKVTKGLEKYDVVVVRGDDPTGKVDVSLTDRNKLVKKYMPDMMLSIHHNALAGVFGKQTGYEILWMQDDEALADRASAFLRKHLDMDVNGIDIGVHGTDPTKYQNLQVLREIPKSIKALLYEIGYMDSVNDYYYITSDAGQQHAADAIVEFVVSELGLALKPIPAPAWEKAIDNSTAGRKEDWKELLRYLSTKGVNDPNVPHQDLLEFIDDLVLKL